MGFSEVKMGCRDLDSFPEMSHWKSALMISQYYLPFRLPVLKSNHKKKMVRFAIKAQPGCEESA